MTFLLKLFAIILILFIASVSSFGQLENWQLKKYDIDDGLPNNANIIIIQDSLEYIWIGTQNGLSKFNGVTFRNYFNEIGDSTSLPGNYVNKLFIDSKNRLFIGTSDGLCYYNIEHDNFTWISSIDRVSVQDITEDKDGSYWVGTQGNGLFKISKNFQKLKQYNTSNEKSRIIGNFVWRLFVDDNLLWIGTLDGRLIYFDKTEESFTEFKEFGNNNGFISAISNDNANNLIVLSDDSGLAKIIRTNNPRKKFEVMRYKNMNYRVMTMLKRPNGEFWLTYLGGIVAFNSEKDNFYNIHSNPKYAGLDFETGVWSVFIDKQQNIWIGGNGLNLISYSYKHFYYFMNPEFKSSIVSEIFRNSRNELILGTDISGIYKKNPNNPSFNRCNYFNIFNKSKVEPSYIFKILETPENNYLVATYRGLFICNPSTNTIEYFHKDNIQSNGLNNNHVNDILQVNNNTYWLATNGGGINIFNSQTKKFKYLMQDDEMKRDSSLINNYCISLLKDHTGKIWIGTYNGLTIYNPANNKFQNFLHDENDNQSISHDWVYYIYEDSEKKIWLGTPNGLNLYIPKSNKFKVFTKQNGLGDNLINGIIEDDKKQLWISTGNGISKISMHDYSCKSYDKDDGLKVLHFARGAIYKDQEGFLYMGGKDGLITFHPDSITFNPNPPVVRITAIKILNQVISSKTHPDILPKELICLKKIAIPYNKSVITLEFTAFNYINTFKNKYAYKLTGFDNDWQYIENRREVTYTNLNPGKYNFQVKASNNDGIWNEEGTSLQIIILPPWWKTLFFKTTVVLAVIGLSVGFYFYRINSLEKQKVYLESLVKERTREVEEKNSQLLQQAIDLNDINTALEENQQRVEEQAEELRVNSDNIKIANELLKEKQALILKQSEDLQEKNHKLTILNATKDKFISIIAHDLKGPFNAILGFSELLMLKYNTLSDDKKQKYITLIFESSHRIFKLLENLLQWARTQTGTIQFNPEVFDFNTIVERNFAFFKEMLEEKQISFIEKLPDAANVFADSNMIDTVLRNLLANAIKFTEKGEITISATPNERHLEVSVSDTGIGIPEEQLSGIFEIDRTMSTHGTRGETGSGLGLLICKEFIEKNGGHIHVKSKPNKGSTFTFTIPIAN
jgi:signal transduction histidine kinase